MFTNKKKAHFVQKLVAVERTIWDLEFKIAKSRQVREGVRQDRERALQGIEAISAQLNGTVSTEEKEKMETEKANMVDMATRFEKQMQMIDTEINGQAPTEDMPQGVQGIMEQIAGFVSLKEMYTDYIKTI